MHFNLLQILPEGKCLDFTALLIPDNVCSFLKSIIVLKKSKKSQYSSTTDKIQMLSDENFECERVRSSLTLEASRTQKLPECRVWLWLGLATDAVPRRRAQVTARVASAAGTHVPTGQPQLPTLASQKGVPFWSQGLKSQVVSFTGKKPPLKKRLFRWFWSFCFTSLNWERGKWGRNLPLYLRLYF